MLDCMLLMCPMMAVHDYVFVSSISECHGASWSYHMCYLFLFHVSSSNSLGICSDRSARQHCWDKKHQQQQVVQDQGQEREGKP